MQPHPGFGTSFGTTMQNEVSSFCAQLAAGDCPLTTPEARVLFLGDSVDRTILRDACHAAADLPESEVGSCVQQHIELGLRTAARCSMPLGWGVTWRLMTWRLMRACTAAQRRWRGGHARNVHAPRQIARRHLGTAEPCARSGAATAVPIS